MYPGPLDPQARRLLVFTATAVGIHLALILAIKLPPERSKDAPARVLEVTLEKPPAVPAPREPTPASSVRPPPSGELEPESTEPDNPVPADETARAEPPELPGVRELLRNVPQGAREESKAFPLKPESHPIFGPGRTVLPPPGRRLLDEKIWQRRRVEQHIRHASLDGRGIWIKHFDNGDMQVCEKPYDDPFDHGDDYWPFACDRPSQ